MFFNISHNQFSATGTSEAGKAVQIDGQVIGGRFKIRLYKIEAGNYSLNFIAGGVFDSVESLRSYCLNRIRETI